METNQHREPWNKGKLVGQKPPLKRSRISWADWPIAHHIADVQQLEGCAWMPRAISSSMPMIVPKGGAVICEHFDRVQAPDCGASSKRSDFAVKFI
jgi:hypothetical protein